MFWIKPDQYLFLAAVMFWSCSSSQKDKSAYELVWNEEFEASALDTTKWVNQTGTGAQLGLVGWGNNELQFYTDLEHNLEFNNGIMAIEARKEDFEQMSYTSTKLITKGKQDWLYGKFEVRAKLPETQGIWPAIWLMPSDSEYGGWPRSGEIDVMEMLGHQPDTVYASTHFGNSFQDRGHVTEPLTLPDGEKFSADFHTYELEWKPDTLKWFIDGKHYHTLTPSDISPYTWPFDKKFYLLLNVAVGGNWPGNPDETTVLPQQMLIDYVRVYQIKEQ